MSIEQQQSSPWESPQSVIISPTGETQVPRGATPGEFFSWIAILGLTGFLFVTNMFAEPPVEHNADSPAPEIANAELIGKLAFFLRDFVGGQAGRDESAKLVEDIQGGPLEQRYCAVIAKSEFDDPTAALGLLDEIDRLVDDRNYTPSDRQLRLRQIVADVIVAQSQMQSFDPGVIAEDDREYLKHQLRWFGLLALSPAHGGGTDRTLVEQKAWRSSVTLMAACVVAAVVLLGGFIGLIIAAMMMFSGFFKSRTDDQVNSGPIYIETFAIWMVVFFALQFGLGAAVNSLNWGIREAMIGLAVIFFGSLVVLIWPVVRGISPSKMLVDVGWKTDNKFSEGATGIFSYVCLTPIMAIALGATVFGIMFSSSGEPGEELAGSRMPIHPIMDHVSSGDLLVIGLIFLSTCVAAPIVEETMFRGVMFRYLRDRTGRWHRFASVAFAAFVNGIIFSAIHPQGLIGIPVLTVLAIGFTLIRQWRQSLVAPMVMHGMNNFLVTFFAVMAMG